ncbi:hypothetical protein [Pseudomonas sp. efr-133-TYG-5]|jgi:hypothetical protein|uniref:hypothetical protein n=1 Tax=Pseudomonas sp. efr-133-TYG-5 TaxID=3040310 RepID=UPI002552D238|nr:hypothetical protein [Pseudomonas sp. efr-133-TYG-5]
MDFPKSVPGIGLVNGKFADENIVTGTPGSLIPAAWGNNVTSEILGVITEAGNTPDEADSAQLKKSIVSLIANQTRQATEATQGSVKIATQQKVAAATDDESAVTPLKLEQRLLTALPLAGAATNLKMFIPADSKIATMTADEIIVSTVLGRSYRLSNFNRTINLAAAGAGGTDNGAVVANGYVALYAIYNPSTATSALMAVNSTGVVAPRIYSSTSMPAGYTASALVSVLATNAAGQMRVAYQMGRQITIENRVLYNTTVGSTVMTGVNIAGYVPPNATHVGLYMSAMQTQAGIGVGMSVAPLASGAFQVATASAAVSNQFSTTSTSVMMPLLVQQTIYVTFANTNAGGFNIVTGSYYI